MSSYLYWGLFSLACSAWLVALVWCVFYVWSTPEQDAETWNEMPGATR